MRLAYGDIHRIVKRGEVAVDGNKYKADELKALNGQKVIVTLDMKNVMEKSVYTLDGKFICKAKRV